MVSATRGFNIRSEIFTLRLAGANNGTVTSKLHSGCCIVGPIA